MSAGAIHGAGHEQKEPMIGDREKIKESLLEELSESWLKANELEAWIADSTHLEERLIKITECLLSFGDNSLENINRLAALCGELMGATYVVYERLDEAGLKSVARWNVPADYEPIDKGHGNACWNSIKLSGSRSIVIRDLDQSMHACTRSEHRSVQPKNVCRKSCSTG